MSVIFDGRGLSETKKAILIKRVGQLKKKGINPSLASLYLTTDPGSVLYTKLKKEVAESVGIKFKAYEIEKRDVLKVIKLIEKLNKNQFIQGILVQKPSGKNDFSSNDWSRIVLTLDPKKDVDGLTPENLGLLAIGFPRFIPATVKAVMAALESGKVKIKSKKVVIVGASEILGKPLSMILTDLGATVSIVHKDTGNGIESYLKSADILISATGDPGIIRGSMVKKGSSLVDVGSPKGDIRTAELLDKAGFISPVPGGIGPMTIISLLENLVDACSELS